jgi:hypothetical protein
MSGRHAGATGQSLPVAVLRLGAILGAVLAVLGGIGLVIYLVVAGYDAEFWGILWLVWAAFFVRSVVRRKPGDVFWPWAAAGQLFLATDNLASSLAARHMWLARDAHVLKLISTYGEWAALACSGIAIVLGIRSGELLWSRSRSRSRRRSGPGPGAAAA